jgi:hypothetical protein
MHWPVSKRGPEHECICLRSGRYMQDMKRRLDKQGLRFPVDDCALVPNAVSGLAGSAAVNFQNGFTTTRSTIPIMMIVGTSLIIL